MESIPIREAGNGDIAQNNKLFAQINANYITFALLVLKQNPILFWEFSQLYCLNVNVTTGAGIFVVWIWLPLYVQT